MTNEQKIAAALLATIEKHNGDMRAAFDSLGGVGFFDDFAGKLYDELNAKK